MSEALFRQEAIDASRVRLTGAVVAATPPGSRLYTSLFGGAIAAAIAFLVLGQYASRVEVTGIVDDRAGIAAISPPGLATVREVMVEEGDFVERGQPLVVVSLSDGRGGDRDGLSGQIADLDRQDSELERQFGLASDVGQAQLGGMRQRTESIAASVRSQKRQIDLVQRQVALARENEKRAQRLEERGAGTKQQVEEARSQILAYELELENLREQLITQTETLNMLQSEIAVGSLNVQRSQSELDQQRAALSEQRLDLVRQHRMTLVAPKSGRVGEIDAKVGSRVAPENNLVSIVPTGSVLEVNLYAPSRAIGFVKPGQKVMLRFDAFPYEKHGAAKGRVLWVSQVPTVPADRPEGVEFAEPMYRIRVELDSQTFRAKGEEQLLRPGMTLTANLVLETRRLWEVMFAPVANVAQGRER